MQTDRKRVVAIALVAVMALSALTGGAVADAPTIDTETVSTTESSDITDGTTLNVSGVGNETLEMTANDSAGDTPELEITVNGSDTVVGTNTSAVNESTNGTVGFSAFNLSVEESDLDDVERTLDENVTTDWTVYQSSNTSNSTTIQVHLNFSDGRTVENIDDVDADPDTDDASVETEDLEDTLTRSSLLQTLDFSELDVDDRSIDGENSEVVLVLTNDTVADDAANAVASDVGDGEPLFGMTLVLQGDETTMPIRVYNEEPADDVDDDDDGDTYGVYEDGGVGGEDGIVIHLGSDFEDDDEVAVTGVLNAGRFASLEHRVTTTDAWQSIGLFLGGIGATDAPDGLVAFAPLAIGAPTARRRPVEDAIEVDDVDADADARGPGHEIEPYQASAEG